MPYQIEVKHPDEWVLELLERAEGRVLRVLHEQASALRNPPCTLEDLAGTLESCGLARSMAKVRVLLGN